MATNLMKERSKSSSTNTQGRRLKSLRQLTGLSRSGFAEVVNISQHTIQSWELERNPLSEKGAKKLLSELKKLQVICSLEWLIYGHGAGPIYSEQRQIDNYSPLNPLSGNLENCVDYSSLIDQESLIQKEIDFFYKNNAGAIVITVTDELMAPQFEVNDYIGGISQKSELENIVGKNCIIKENSNHIFRRFSKIIDDNKILLLGTNPYYENNASLVNINDINSIFLVVWHRKKIPSTLL